MNENERTITPEEQKQALQSARDAAAAGDPMGMLKNLYHGFVLDGMKSRLAARWSQIPTDDVDYFVAQAVDILYEQINLGEKVFNITAYLWKVAERKATDYHRIRKKERSLPPDELSEVFNSSRVAVHQRTSEEMAEEEREKEEQDRKRRQSITIARSLLPRLGLANVQAVMAYVIDAAEARREDLQNIEIADALGLSLETVRQAKSRGFRRLSRIAKEEGLVERKFCFEDLKIDDEEDASS